MPKYTKHSGAVAELITLSHLCHFPLHSGAVIGSASFNRSGWRKSSSSMFTSMRNNDNFNWEFSIPTSCSKKGTFPVPDPKFCTWPRKRQTDGTGSCLWGKMLKIPEQFCSSDSHKIIWLAGEFWFWESWTSELWNQELYCSFLMLVSLAFHTDTHTLHYFTWHCMAKRKQGQYFQMGYRHYEAKAGNKEGKLTHPFWWPITAQEKCNPIQRNTAPSTANP